MFTIYDQIKKHLEKHSYARERKFRDRALVDMLLEKHGDGSMFFPTGKLEAFARDFESYSRMWRLVLQENEELRGEDYGDKVVLEQREQIKLGYEPGHHEDVKTLSKV